MPQYLVAFEHPENYGASLEGEAMIREISALNEERVAPGARFLAGGLESASHAKALRRRGVAPKTHPSRIRGDSDWDLENFPRGLKPRMYCGAGGRPEGRPFQNVASADSTRGFGKFETWVHQVQRVTSSNSKWLQQILNVTQSNCRT